MEFHNMLSHANVSHKFMLAFSHVSWSLIQVIKGRHMANFDEEARQKSFEYLNHCFYSGTIPILPNLQLPFESQTPHLW
jgi:hypothetical protein